MYKNKRGKSLIVVIIIIVLLIGLSFLVFRQGPKIIGMTGKVVLDFSNQENFADGVYTTSEYAFGIKLISGSSSGSYTSQIVDAGNIASWNNISWRQGLCYQCELPNNKQSDAGDYDVPLNMAGNVLLLHMNEASGAIIDSSGNGNDFVNNGADSASGKFNMALGFDSGDYIEDDDAENYLNFLTTFTISLWIKSDVTNTDKGFIIGRNPNNQDNTIAIRYDAEGLYGGCVNCIKAGISVSGDEQQLESSNNTQTTNWQHLTLVWQSGEQLKLYVNGVEDIPSYNTQAKTGSISNITTLIIGKGARDPGSKKGWDGLIDEVAIFDRALSSNEILNIYKRGILNLALSVRSCDDYLCDGEAFTSLTTLSPQNLGLNNQYFQYKFDLSTSNTAYSPLVSSVAIDYNASKINNAPICSLIPDVAFNSGESSSINLQNYFSDEDNNDLTYYYSAENVSISLTGSLAEITSSSNLSGSVVFSGSDGINLTYCNVVYVFVNVSISEQNQTQNETGNNETNITNPPVENPAPSPGVGGGGGGGGGGGYGGGGSSSSTTSNVTNLTAKNTSETINSEISANQSAINLANETNEITPTITTRAINAETPIQRLTSFFKQASLTTTQAIRDVGVKLFNLKGDSKIGNVLAVAITVVLVIGIISFAWFIRKARNQKLPKVRVGKKA